MVLANLPQALYLGEIGFVVSCKSPEQSKWIAFASPRRQGVVLGDGRAQNPSSEEVDPEVTAFTASDSKQLIARD